MSASHGPTVCREHKTVYARCRCMGPHVLKKVPCRGGDCAQSRNKAWRDPGGSGVIFWIEPQLDLTPAPEPAKVSGMQINLDNATSIILTDVLHKLWDEHADIEVGDGIHRNVRIESVDDFNLDVKVDGGEGPRISIPREEIVTITVLG